MDPFLGEIRPVGFNFAPVGWALCQGQILPISQNTALFSLLGTTYGGNGQTTFALPDLRGRVPVGRGQGPGLAIHDLGEVSGEENHTLVVSTLPAHSHSATASTHPATSYSSSDTPAVSPRDVYGTADGSALASDTVVSAGGNQPHNNMQPFLTVNFVIALQGIFPPRN